MKIILPTSRFALAVSGGVDSLALCLLCRDRDCVSYTVNHNLRPNSASEARAVSELVKSLGIPNRILDITAGRTEGSARRARYEALYHACIEDNIGTIVTAHHLDDLHESIILRILQGHAWKSLASINRISKIPIRAHRSIALERPLLHIPKKELRDLCIQKGIKWFEDETNGDVGYTTRNAVRQFLNNPLPRALCRSSVIALSRDLRTLREEYYSRIDDEISRTGFTIDARTGRASFNVRRVIDSPYRDGILQVLGSRVSPALNPRIKDCLHTGRGGGCLWTINGDRCHIRRQPFTRDFNEEWRVTKDFKLWDNRFWIRGDECSVGRYRSFMGQDELFKSLGDQTIPVLFDDHGIIAFPSLGIKFRDHWYECEFRY